jgi:hypothetical protein
LTGCGKSGKEGIVFKRRDAAYVPGRPASGGDQLKLKFTATASAIVAGADGSRRSVKLELLDGPRRVGVGNVTIPANHPIPAVNQIVEVRYLYAYPGGSLYQPVYLGKRDDVGVDIVGVFRVDGEALYAEFLCICAKAESARAVAADPIQQFIPGGAVIGGFV